MGIERLNMIDNKTGEESRIGNMSPKPQYTIAITRCRIYSFDVTKPADFTFGIQLRPRGYSD